MLGKGAWALLPGQTDVQPYTWDVGLSRAEPGSSAQRCRGGQDGLTHRAGEDERRERSGRAGDRPRAAPVALRGRSGPRSAPHCRQPCPPALPCAGAARHRPRGPARPRALPCCSAEPVVRWGIAGARQGQPWPGCCCCCASRRSAPQVSPRGVPGARLPPAAAVTPSASLAGLGPTIDGRVLAARALHEGESRAFTCRAPRPAATLAWYLDGRQQEPDSPAEHSAASTFTLTARRTDRQLTCALTDPASGDVANASVHLDVQCKLWVLSLMRAALVCVGLAKGSVAHGALASPSAVLTAVSARPVAPEILRADARYAEAEGPGLLVVLLALVQANPPAAVTWVGPDGRAVANASELLTLDAGSRPALANHTVRLRLGAAAGSFSVSAANGLGVANASVPAPGLPGPAPLPPR
ncbi:transmembrane protein 25 [Apteryx rowi]|uniref:transmembrane protein 25 n=1 Tax=Apteryx rowi TaxID=308060 RepID=UPI000E1E173C|nr:transmembrane protein 25 [Apteryx rowi]